MTYLNGGYSIIKKNDANIFAKVNDALTNGKPILFYENENTCYYIDTMEKTGSDSIALTKGGKTIVITSANVVTEIGDIHNHLYAYKFDSKDLNLDSGSVSSNNYYTLLTSLNISKLSDLPKGTYAVTTGAITIDGNEISIDYIEIGDNSYTLWLSNDDNIAFTINSDSTYNNKVTLF